MPDMNMMNQRPVTDDREAAMARADLYKLANYSMKLFKMIHDGDQLEGWVQAKITKAADYVASVYHFMEYEMKFSEYGERLEASDMYAESVKQEFREKLMEAKKKLEKLNSKNQKELDEVFGSDAKVGDKAKTTKGTATKTKTGMVHTRDKYEYDPGSDDKEMSKIKRDARNKKVKEDFKAGMQVPQDVDGASATASPKKTGNALTPAQGAALMKSKDPNAYNKMKGIKTPAKTTTAVSDPEGVPAKPVKEGSKPDFLDMDKDGNKKEPMKKAVADKKKNPFAKTTEALKGGQKNLDVDKDGKLEKSDFAKLRSSKGVKEASHQEKTTMKHVKNPTAGEKKAAKDIKPGVKGYADRVAMLKSAEKDGRLKEGSKNLKQQAAIAIAKKKDK